MNAGVETVVEMAQNFLKMLRRATQDPSAWNRRALDTAGGRAAQGCIQGRSGGLGETDRRDAQGIPCAPRKRKWGSCSSLGQARFSTDLLAQPAQFRHEAIVHELLHLKVPNQRKSFRSLLKAYLGHVATQTLPHRIRRQDGDEESTLARQARFLEQLKAMQSVAMYSGRSIHA